MSNHSLDLFLEACGGRKPLHLDVEFQGKQEAARRVLYQPFVLIGREARADMYLNYPQVSKRHAYLQMIAGRLFCIDLQSRTGTHWQWGPKRSGWVDYQQAIRIGPCWIRLTDEERNGQGPGPNDWIRSAAEFLGQQELPEVTLEFITQADKPKTWQMSPVLALVGKSPDCRVHLVGRTVSRFHCSLVRTPLGVWAIDLLGRDGILVNDAPVRCVRLDEGDCLQVGKFSMRIHYDSRPLSRLHSDEVNETLRLRLDSVANPESLAPTNSNAPAPSVGAVATVTTTVASAGTAPAAMSTTSGQLVPAPPQFLAAHSELAQAILVPVAKQLGLMQQQMFDQFQQAMLMMFQMFNTLQRDQVNLISEELQHLRELAEEVHELQMELARRPHAAGEPREATTTMAVPQAEVISSSSVHPSSPEAAFPFESAPKPYEPSVSVREPAAAAVAGSAQGGTAAAPSTAKKAVTAEPRKITIPQGKSTAEIHAWLNERITAIQKERQTRWQKILAFMTGEGGPKP